MDDLEAPPPPGFYFKCVGIGHHDCHLLYVCDRVAGRVLQWEPDAAPSIGHPWRLRIAPFEEHMWLPPVRGGDTALTCYVKRMTVKQLTLYAAVLPLIVPQHILEDVLNHDVE